MLDEREIEALAQASTRRIRNFHDREDACQEYRIAAWQAGCRAEEGKNPEHYQKVCGRGAVLNFFRTLRRQLKTVSLDAPHFRPAGDAEKTLHDVLPSLAPQPAEIIADRDFLEKLHWLIRQLPRLQREVMEMWLGGLSTNEIATKVGHTRQAVNRRKSAVLRKLKHRLERGAA